MSTQLSPEATKLIDAVLLRERDAKELKNYVAQLEWTNQQRMEYIQRLEARHGATVTQSF